MLLVDTDEGIAVQFLDGSHLQVDERLTSHSDQMMSFMRVRVLDVADEETLIAEGMIRLEVTPTGGPMLVKTGLFADAPLIAEADRSTPGLVSASLEPAGFMIRGMKVDDVVVEVDGEAVQPSEICHMPPGAAGRQRTLRVPHTALPAHLRHGDTLGACP
jgi:hypothetical protein